jgi:serine/threonine-protein kinase
MFLYGTLISSFALPRPVQIRSATALAVKLTILPSRYRGPEQIGRGGMGDIYRATDSVLGRVVAIKILAERYAQDESVRERFTREALSAARLSGEPNSVTIYDVGEHEDRPYIVMEYLGGGSLDDALRSGGPQPPERVFTWLAEAARALDVAHREGVVHRDIKPANLMLDGEGHVHVADFGIASSAHMDSLTMTGTVLGTAGYLSPEQAQGERAGAASDRYALAIVAWELLTGRRPFESESTTAEAAAHINAPIPAISSAGNLPRELDRVFERALAKQAAQRYGTAGQFVADLRSAFSAARSVASGWIRRDRRARFLPLTPRRRRRRERSSARESSSMRPIHALATDRAAPGRYWLRSCWPVRSAARCSRTSSRVATVGHRRRRW